MSRSKPNNQLRGLSGLSGSISSMADAWRTSKTFFLNTPADLLEKLRWEKDALWASAPFDLQQRAYMVMNCAITAWQMKDWVYNALEDSERLNDLSRYTGNRIRDAEAFGKYLTEKNSDMRMAYQIATASKHRQLRQHRHDPHIRTTVEPVKINLRGGYQRDELFIVDKHESMLAHELIDRLYIKWKEVLHALNLISQEEPIVSVGDRPLPPRTSRLRRERP